MNRWIFSTSLAVMLFAVAKTEKYDRNICLNSTGRYFYNQTKKIKDTWTFSTDNYCSINSSVLVVQLENSDPPQCDGAFIEISGYKKIQICLLGKMTCLLMTKQWYFTDLPIIENCTNVILIKREMLPSVTINKPGDKQGVFALNYAFMQINATNKVTQGEQPGSETIKQTDGTTTAVLASIIVLLCLLLIGILIWQHWNNIKKAALHLRGKINFGERDSSIVPPVHVAAVANGVLHEGGTDNPVYEEAEIDGVYHEVEAQSDRVVVDNQLYGSK